MKKQYCLIIFTVLTLLISCKQSDLDTITVSKIDTLIIVQLDTVFIEEEFTYTNTFTFNNIVYDVDSVNVLENTIYNTGEVKNYKFFINSDLYYLKVLVSTGKEIFDNYYFLNNENVQLLSFRTSDLNYLTGYIKIKGDVNLPSIIIEGYLKNQECKFNYSK